MILNIYCTIRVLQAAGDAKSPMYSIAVGMWVIRVVGIYVLGIHFEMGISGIWLAITIDLFTRAIFLAWRYKRTFRKRKV